MSNNYFAIERHGACKAPVMLVTKNGYTVFKDFLEMSYDEMKSSVHLLEFINASMDAANNVFAGEDDQTIITLVDKNGIFIWSIIMNSCGDNDEDLRYCFVDWKKDGKSYRYEP